MFQNIGTTELLIVAAVLLVLFGGRKLPELARGVGDSIKEFRKAVKETV
jgi:sec-independent protein translocase protein TatA